MPNAVELLLWAGTPWGKSSPGDDVQRAEEGSPRNFGLTVQPARELALANVKCLSQLPSPAEHRERPAQRPERGVVAHVLAIASSDPSANRRILSAGGGTQPVLKHFRREGAGIWVCVEPATLDLPQGRVQAVPGTRFVAGTTFMNIDVAHLLDEEFSRQEDTQR